MIYNHLHYGAAIAPPIAALGIFIGLRAWSIKITEETESYTTTRPASNSTPEPEE